MPDARQPAGEVVGAFETLELPLALIDLESLTVTAVSRAALRAAGASAAVVGRPVPELFDERDRPHAARALEAMRDGVIDFYRAHRRLDPVELGHVCLTGWVRAVEFDGRRIAVAELAFGAEPAGPPLATYLGREPASAAIGTTDTGWTVTALSSDVATLLGPARTLMVGASFLDAVAPSERDRVVAADRWAAGQVSISLAVTMGDQPLRCVLTSLVGTVGRCFMLLASANRPGRDAVARVSQLEQHLWRIAAEVEASGVLQHVGAMPDPARTPQLEALTVRQWEVLSRLARGQRVPTIAAEMSISQSTVRNHLSAIFERFGVHSQAALLERLSSPPHNA